MQENMKNVQKLDEEDLENVSGGAGEINANQTIQRDCPKCGTVKLFRLASGGRAYCMECGTQIII